MIPLLLMLLAAALGFVILRRVSPGADSFRRSSNEAIRRSGRHDQKPRDTLPAQMTMLDADGHRFLGRFATSPNGRFRFGWQDFHYDSMIGGARTGGMGQVVLLEGKRIRYRMDLQRPNDGAVADSGIAVVNDWLFDPGLTGVFHLLSPNGDIIIAQRFSANLFKCGIGRDGNVAWCTTANAPSNDGAVLAVFDIDAGRMIYRVDRPHTWQVTNVRLDGECLLVEADGGITYRYLPNGELENREQVEHAVEQWKIAKGTPRRLLEVVESRLARLGAKGIETESGQDLLHLLAQASEGLSDHKAAARINRRKGEVLHALGRTAEAIDVLRQAIELDDKVGAKRLLSRLERDLPPRA